MNRTNPIVRTIANGRPTVEEKLEAWRVLRDDTELRTHLKLDKFEKRQPKLVALAETVDAAKQLKAVGDEIKGLRTGYKDLDKMTGGLNPSEILVLFADTGIGKSLFSQNVTLNIVKRGEPVLFVGLEMSNAENTLRIMQMNSPENDDLYALPILYPASNDLGYKDLDGVMEAAKAQRAVMVVVDHLHMFEVGNANRADGIEDICKEFKRVTRKHEMPMLLVSHISKRYGKTAAPELDDLKGSTAIKQIADVAITLHKDPRRYEADPATTPLQVICRKQRKGWRKRKFELTPQPNGRLVESVEISVFPQGLTIG